MGDRSVEQPYQLLQTVILVVSLSGSDELAKRQLFVLDCALSNTHLIRESTTMRMMMITPIERMPTVQYMHLPPLF